MPEEKMKQSLEEGQIVLCNVEKIVGTSVFVKLEDYDLQGSITFPEISPGRIRNIRDFVFPGKKIVCKVLQIKENHVELSLRRVKVGERNEFNDHYKKERSYTAMLRTMLGDKADKILKDIKEKENGLLEFIDSARDNLSLLEKYFNKEQIERITKIFNERKSKETVISRKFMLSSKESNGINIVKIIISEASKGIACEVSYLAAGKYLIKIKSKNPKQAETQINQIIDKIEDLSKKKYCSSCNFNAIKD